MTHSELAQSYRDDPHRHYNCSQSVMLPFAQETGLTQDQICALNEHFGGGIRMGATCGAVTGALMALGLMGKDEAAAAEFRRRFREAAGHMNCAQLLKAAQENGEAKKPHCDRMVRLAVELVDEM